MDFLIQYYTLRIKKLSIEIKHLNKKIHLIGTIRLLLVVGGMISVYIFHEDSWGTILGIVTIFLLPFILLMSLHNKLFNLRYYKETKLKLNQNELNGLHYDYSAFNGAPEEIDLEHSFSLDLDIFGDKSLYQSINRTVTFLGGKMLASWFKNPLDKKEDIIKRQEAIKELSTRPDSFQDFYTKGKKQENEKKDNFIINSITSESFSTINNRLWNTIIWIIPLGWLLIIGGNVFNLISEKWIGIYLAVSFIIAYWKTKEINALYQSADKLETIFNSFSGIIKHIENQTFEAEILKKEQNCFLKNNNCASHELINLSKHIRALNQRFSLAGCILNLLTLRDTRQAIKIEKWKFAHQKDLRDWLEALATFDALYSLGNFAFNNPTYIFPEISDEYFIMKGKKLGHPLINRKVCVKNDVEIPHDPWFCIITGANMAGKSTYLRTVGVNYLLACIGAPVCAQELSIYPAHLVTSLRTSDSLSSNESYFFAELKRLKSIIDRLHNGEKLFIILDEILKGTNSIDKQKGSIALMKQLIANDSCGIIATHDLILGTLEKEFPDNIKNYSFEADIRNNELNFSYQLRPGIAQNMNACFLMKKMGITI